MGGGVIESAKEYFPFLFFFSSDGKVTECWYGDGWGGFGADGDEEEQFGDVVKTASFRPRRSSLTTPPCAASADFCVLIRRLRRASVLLSSFSASRSDPPD